MGVLAATLQHVQAHQFLKQMKLCVVSFWGEEQLSDMQLQICHFIPVVPNREKAGVREADGP